MKHLIFNLVKAGIIKTESYQSARNTIEYWIKTGKLILRREASSKYWLMNEKEIKEIVKEFSTRSHKWHYK